MSSSSEISRFYDSFRNRQEKIGVNLRHRTILKKLKQNGLKKAVRILEVGCGIGTLTSLIRKTNGNARITATDISPENIATARRLYGESINWLVSDMSDFSAGEPFDLIIFADVLEHIPVPLHEPLFQKLADCSHSETRICINIPHPDFLDYTIKHHPESLQIVDQPLHGPMFFGGFQNAGFKIDQLESYSIWTKQPDYQWLILKKAIPYVQPGKHSKFKILLKRFLARF